MTQEWFADRVTWIQYPLQRHAVFPAEARPSLSLSDRLALAVVLAFWIFVLMAVIAAMSVVGWVVVQTLL